MAATTTVTQATTTVDPKIISGTKWANIIRAEVKDEVSKLPIKPKLVGILVGDRADSKIYVESKKKAFLEAGMDCEVIYYPEDVPESELIDKIRSINEDSSVHGILLQRPVPLSIDEKKVLNMVDRNKDVDGIASPLCLGQLVYKGYTADFIPCTAKGCIELLKREGIEIAGKHAVILGRSPIVGAPVALALLKEDATITVCHRQTVNIDEVVKTGDIVVVGIGCPLYVKGEWFKPGAVIIDVGINRIEDKTKVSGSRLVGDVDFEGAYKVCSKITPVPGGCGPMTIAMLLVNTLEAAQRSL